MARIAGINIPNHQHAVIGLTAIYGISKCGLVNINNQDQDCFKWCMKYHQTSRGKDCQNISALKKVQDKYNYDGIEFPVSYDDIYKFEKLNNICIYVYSIL